MSVLVGVGVTTGSVRRMTYNNRAHELALPFWSAWDLSAELNDNVYHDLVQVIENALREGRDEGYREGCAAMRRIAKENGEET